MTLYETKNAPLTIEELDNNFKELDSAIKTGLHPQGGYVTLDNLQAHKDYINSEFETINSEIDLKLQNMGGILSSNGVEIKDDIKIISLTIDNLVLNANDRINQQPEIPNFPSGYEIVAYKQISCLKATNATDDAWKKVIIQSFSTTGGGIKPNISLYNFGDTEAVVKLSISALCKKVL